MGIDPITLALAKNYTNKTRLAYTEESFVEFGEITEDKKITFSVGDKYVICDYHRDGLVIQKGKTYRIKINDLYFDAVCDSLVIEGIEVFYLGNLVLFDTTLTDTKEEFIFFTYYDDADSAAQYLDNPYAVSITVNKSLLSEYINENMAELEVNFSLQEIVVHPEVVHKIDPKYYERLAWEEEIIDNSILFDENVLFESGNYEGNLLFDLEPDKKYTVTIDEKSYTTNSIDLTSLYNIEDAPDDAKIICLGNIGLIEKTFNLTDEPFYIHYISCPSESEYLMIFLSLDPYSYNKDTFDFNDATTYNALNGNHHITITLIDEKTIVHKIDPKFYDKLAWEEEIPVLESTIVDLGDEDIDGQNHIIDRVDLEVGAEYIVTIDGKSYRRTCYELKMNGDTMSALGANSFSSLINSPFIIATIPECTMIFLAKINENTGEPYVVFGIHEISISKIVVHKIDAKFYDRLGGEEILDEILLEDKYYEVIDGELSNSRSLINFPIIKGDTYVVTINGKSYTLIADECNIDGMDAIYFGDALSFSSNVGDDESNLSYPFIFVCTNMNNLCFTNCYIFDIENQIVFNGMCRLSVIHKLRKIHKIDSKFYDCIAHENNLLIPMVEDYNFISESDSDTEYGVLRLDFSKAKLGDVYHIIYDGVTYICPVKYVNECLLIGNAYMIFKDRACIDEKIPFLFYVEGSILLTDTIGSHVVSCYKEYKYVDKYIDSKFLPNETLSDFEISELIMQIN